MFDDQWPFCLVAMATLNFKKKIFLNDNSSKTTEVVGLLFGTNVALLRTIQNSEVWRSASWFGCHSNKKLPKTYNGKMVKLHLPHNQ